MSRQGRSGPQTPGSSSNGHSIEFRRCPRIRLFAASRRVAARDGLRALTILAIATEAKRAPGTVGVYKIEQYVRDIVEYCFVPLLAICEQQPALGALARRDIEQRIDAYLKLQPETPALIMQARALAATPAGHRAPPDELSLQNLFQSGRAAARQAISARLADQSDALGVYQGTDADQLIRYYLDVCERLTGTE